MALKLLNFSEFFLFSFYGLVFYVLTGSIPSTKIFVEDFEGMEDCSNKNHSSQTLHQKPDRPKKIAP